MGRRRRKTEIGGGAGGVLFRGGSSHEISRAGRECFYGDRGYGTDGKSNSDRRVRFGPSLSSMFEDAGRDTGRSSRLGGRVA